MEGTLHNVTLNSSFTSLLTKFQGRGPGAWAIRFTGIGVATLKLPKSAIVCNERDDQVPIFRSQEANPVRTMPPWLNWWQH